MRVAVTGASGFVGGRIARALARAGHDVRSFGRRAAGTLARPLPNYATWDIESGALADAGVDAVVHCAALVGDYGPESRYRAANVGGTAAVLNAFAAAQRFILMSSSSVYSDGARTDVHEDAGTGDCRYSAYGRTKAEAERLVLARRADAVVLRPHIVYGPGDTTLLPRLLASSRVGRLAIPGDGRNRLSVTHVDNLVLAVERALASSASGAFNVADAEPTTADTLLRTVLERVGATDRVVYVPRSLAWSVATVCEGVWPSRDGPRGPPLTRYVVKSLADDHTLDITRARRELGYAPTWSFRDGPLVDDA